MVVYALIVSLLVKMGLGLDNRNPRQEGHYIAF